MKSLRPRSVLAVLAMAIAPLSPLTGAENTGQVQQRIIAGTLVDTATQKKLSLVTVRGSVGPCSGTLLNRYWVLTADHCISTNGAIAGPGTNPASITVDAVWSTPAVPPVAVFVWRPVFETGQDIALIFLGDKDFGETAPQLMNTNALGSGDTFIAYGRGISAYARAGSPPTPAVQDGLYRSANQAVSSVLGDLYMFTPNVSGAIAAGGDSGGPDYTLDGNGGPLLIAGVHSACEGEFIQQSSPGDWTFVTRVKRCSSTGLWPVYQEIAEVSRRQHAEFCNAYGHEATLANSVASRMPGCGQNDGRFKPDTADHIGWCMGQTIEHGATFARKTATEHSLGRVQVLEQCEFARTSGAIIQAQAPDVSLAPPSSIVFAEGPSAQITPSAPSAPAVDTCKSPFVWREARPSDHVCVPVAARTRTRQENKLARVREDPYVFGKDCLAGFVWREAYPGDVVCVHPETRSIVRQENALAATRRVGG